MYRVKRYTTHNGPCGEWVEQPTDNREAASDKACDLSLEDMNAVYVAVSLYGSERMCFLHGVERPFCSAMDVLEDFEADRSEEPAPTQYLISRGVPGSFDSWAR